MLYKVKVETELMVVASNPKEAVDIAKKNASSEISNYGKGSALVINDQNEIPEDWKNVIPYSSNGVVESKKCIELVSSRQGRVGLEEDEINHIIKIQEAKKNTIAVNSVNPETRSDPIPPKMDWNDSKSGRPVEKLRFIR